MILGDMISQLKVMQMVINWTLFFLINAFKSTTKFRIKYYKQICNSVYKFKTSFGSSHLEPGESLIFEQ